MRRLLCVWFPNWPIQRMQHARPDIKGRPLVLFAEQGRAGMLVVACSQEAAAMGVRPGWPLAEVAALWPSGKAGFKTPSPKPVWLRCEPEADREALRHIAGYSQRYAPLAGVETSAAPESLLLDIAGCEHLHGGERGLLQALMQDFSAQGHVVRMAVADTVGAAWAVARHGDGMVSVPTGQQQQALCGLPLAALRIAPDVCDALRQLEVLTIGDLQRLPRASLPSRFGKELLRRLDEAFGIRVETFTAEKFVEPLSRTWTTEHPLASQRGLEEVFRHLLEPLLETLNARRAGLVDLHCEFAAEQPVEPIRIRLSRPTSDEKHLRQLFALRCERHAWAEGILKMKLAVERAGWLGEKSRSLFGDEEEASARAVEGLLERLSSRMGDQAVSRFMNLPDPLPERSFRFQPCLTEQAAQEVLSHVEQRRARHRPSRLLRRPRQLDVLAISPQGPPSRVECQGQSRRIERAWGPERIESGWWRSQDVQRDYYRIETEHGEHWWVFRELGSGVWFLHGWF